MPRPIIRLYNLSVLWDVSADSMNTMEEVQKNILWQFSITEHKTKIESYTDIRVQEAH